MGQQYEVQNWEKEEKLHFYHFLLLNNNLGDLGESVLRSHCKETYSSWRRHSKNDGKYFSQMTNSTNLTYIQNALCGWKVSQNGATWWWHHYAVGMLFVSRNTEAVWRR